MTIDQANLTPISTEKAAKRMGVTRCTVVNMIKRGELTAIRVGRVYRIAPADVARLSPAAPPPTSPTPPAPSAG